MDSIAEHLRDHRFTPLFTDCLGWEPMAGTISVSVDSREFVFVSVARKRGIQVLCCAASRFVLINRVLLRKIQRRVAQVYQEHILIFFSERPRKQVWQWTIRPSHRRRVRHWQGVFFSNCPSKHFLRRLAGIRSILDGEHGVSLAHGLNCEPRARDPSAYTNRLVRRRWYARRSDNLVRALKNGDAGDLHRFVVFHLPLAHKFSQRLCRWFGMLPEDAEQIGALGLMEAARRFRPGVDRPFPTYAKGWIANVCRCLGPDFAFLIRHPAEVFWACFGLRLAVEHIACQSGSPGVPEFLNDLELHDSALARQRRDFERLTDIRSLSDPKRHGYRAARQIAERRPGPETYLEEAARARDVRNAVSRLRTRAADVIRLRYGLYGYRPQTLAEIGQLYGLTREAIRQIQVKAEVRLRELLAREHDDTPAHDALERTDGLADAEDTFRLFRLGDRVRSIKGGPIMEVREYDGEHKVRCSWYEVGKGWMARAYREESLQRIGRNRSLPFSTVD
jgi:RNA polymerase sigma factor (sigma-70 family)